MRRLAPARWIVAAALLALVGCSNNPIALQNQVKSLQQQQSTLTMQNQELVARANTLDQDNQELSTLLAREQQQSRLFADQTSALREQLSDITAQLSSLREEYADTSQRTTALAASLKRKSGASITANRSFGGTLPDVNISGVEVRRDGDVIRVELPGSRLFAQGSARLLPDAPALIESVAAEVARTYPKQFIGIEGHTDSDPIQASEWHNNHQLSTGRAMAVYDHLVARSALTPKQLFVVGHGENHPVVSNATPAGKERNRRVELVIYPDQVPDR